MGAQVNVVAGFLGTGKTTVLTRQLDVRRGQERIGVLVNDFGEASIDRVTIEENDAFSISEVRGGCVCCTAPEGFIAALTALVDRGLDRIFIEPTGLALPADLIDSIQRSSLSERLTLGPLVVLVDPRNLGDGLPSLQRAQIEAADVLVASRVDLASEVSLQRFDALAASLWPAPLRILRAQHGELPPDAFDWPEGEGPRRELQDAGACGECGHSHPHVHHHPGAAHGHVTASRIWPLEVVFHRERLVDAVARLAAGVDGAKLVRLKGLFRTLEGTWRLEVAGSTAHEDPSGYRRDSRVDVILESDDPVALEAAMNALEAARLAEDERTVRSDELVVSNGTDVLALDWERLRALPEQVDDVSAVVPGREGQGVRMSAVLRAAGIDLSAGEALVAAADGFASPPVPVSALAMGIVLHSLDGAPLPAKMGGPFRLLIPGDAGPAGPCSNVKAVVRVTLR